MSGSWMGVGTVTLLGMLLVAGGCSGDDPPLAPPKVKPSSATIVVAGRTLTVELALDDSARARGLMHRTHLEDGAGMLFIFRDDRIRNFWMKDTLIPLDLAFLQADGTLVNVGHGQPGVEKPGVYSDRPARMVLELRAGWCAEHGFEPGDRADVPQELLALAE